MPALLLCAHVLIARVHSSSFWGSRLKRSIICCSLIDEMESVSGSELRRTSYCLSDVFVRVNVGLFMFAFLHSSLC